MDGEIQVEMTRREREIIKYLLTNGESKCKNIAVTLNVSEKTIRNEVKTLNTIFDCPLIISTTNGFYIDEKLINNAIELINNCQINENEVILCHLLLNKQPNNFFELAEYFYLSSSSLQTKIKEINTMIQRYNLKALRKNSKVFIEGKEYDKYLLFQNILYNNNSFFDLKKYELFFPDIDIKSAKITIKKIVEKHGYNIPTFYEINLIVNILIIISFYKNKDLYVMSSREYIPEIKIATDIVNAFIPTNKNKFYILNIIAYNLVGIIKSNNSTKHSKKSYSQDFFNTVSYIVKEVFTHNYITVDSYSFISILADHIYELINRLKSGNYFKVPNIISIKLNSLYIYDIAIQLCQKFNNKFNISIPEDEIALVAIHIGFAIEASFNKMSSKLNLLLYTGNYDLIDQYITNNIIHNYKDKINLIKIKSLNNLYMQNNFDLLITTESYFQNKIYDYCLISPLLTESDKNKINYSISKALNKKKKKDFNLMVNEYFDKDFFFLNTELSDYKEVLHFLNNKLLKKGIIDENFLPSVLQRESLNPTCFMNEFSIPHPMKPISLKSKVAVLINPNKIKWDYQEVQIVFLTAISLNENASQKKLFEGLSELLADNKKIYQLKNITNFQDFINFLTNNN